MKKQVIVASASLLVCTFLLTGCSQSGSGLAKDICSSPGQLSDIEGDPNTETGAGLWMKYYNLANDLRNTEGATDAELKVANAMDEWVGVALEMDEQDRGWGEYGSEFSDKGLALISACEPYID